MCGMSERYIATNAESSSARDGSGNACFIVVFVYCWRALFAGNTRNMDHGGGIANIILLISETFFIEYY
jgi:hypothetical protein